MSEKRQIQDKTTGNHFKLLKKQESRFLTVVEQFMDCLREGGACMWGRQPYTGAWSVWPGWGSDEAPSEDSSRMQFCYADKEELGKPGSWSACGAAASSPGMFQAG